MWQPRQDVDGWRLRLSTPGGGVVELETGTAAPTLTLQDLRDALGEVPDGEYIYEISAAQRLDAATRAAVRRARETGAPLPAGVLETGRSLRQSGGFLLVDGHFHYDETAVEETDQATEAVAATGFDTLRVAPTPTPAADHQTFDTSSPFGFTNGFGVRDSLCVGADCQTVEDYDLETIRLKENNTRIGFDDTTSSTDTFPDRDWQLIANDNTDGGQEYFSLLDDTSGDRPLTVAGGAPANAVYVASWGGLGLGTATPTEHIHIVHGDTPAIRLEQDNSLGGSGHSWKVRGDDNELALESISGESVPFRIKVGSDTNSIVLAPSKRVGMGTYLPTASLHLVRSDGTANLRIEELSTTTASRALVSLANNGPISMVFGNQNDVNWNLATLADGFAIHVGGSAQHEFKVTESGDVIIQGTLTENSNRESKTAIKEVDPSLVLAKVLDLPIATWQRRGIADVTHLGPMAQDFRALFGLGVNDTSISTVDMAGVALAAVQGLHRDNDRLREENQALRRGQEDLVAQLAALAERLTALEAEKTVP